MRVWVASPGRGLPQAGLGQEEPGRFREVAEKEGEPLDLGPYLLQPDHVAGEGGGRGPPGG